MTASRNLEQLLKVFSSFEERSWSMQELWRQVASIPLEREDFREHARFSDCGYQRNLLYDGPGLRALALCWRSGQRSPIHNHAGSSCLVRVVEGTATEVAFRRGKDGFWCPCKLTELRQGQQCMSVDDDTHLIGNFQAPGEDLLTLHMYSPPLLGMRVVEVEATIFRDDARVIQAALAGVDEQTRSDWAGTRRQK